MKNSPKNKGTKMMTATIDQTYRMVGLAYYIMLGEQRIVTADTGEALEVRVVAVDDGFFLKS